MVEELQPTFQESDLNVRVVFVLLDVPNCVVEPVSVSSWVKEHDYCSSTDMRLSVGFGYPGIDIVIWGVAPDNLLAPGLS